MAQFNGQLNSNEITSSLFNMIISQQINSDKLNLSGALVEKARADGSLYGDTKIFYDFNILYPEKYNADTVEQTNVLALNRITEVKQQAIVLDQFRQIAVTVDDFLSKRAWSNEGIFAEFNSYILSLLSKTKLVYETLLYNVFLGTEETSEGKQIVEIDLTGATTPEARAKKIAEELANLYSKVGDVSRDYNDYGYVTAYSLGSLDTVWNAKYVSELRKVDMPAIFHNEGLIDKFAENVLPARYFGTVNTSATEGDGSVFAKDAITIGTSKYLPGDVVKSGEEAPAGESVTPKANVICKIFPKGKWPIIMSGFSVGSEFYNPKNLSHNHYLTFGYNLPQHFEGAPFITVVEKE